MKIIVDPRKSLEENAELFFSKAKKARAKAKGAREALEKTRQKESIKELTVTQRQKVVKRAWFEKFHWFLSSDGFLVLGGRDATTNEIVVKKHAKTHDVIFHTDMSGSPFVIIQNPNEERIPERTLEEAAQFCACHSKAWKLGMPGLDVFHVTPEQVSKTPNPGEFLPKGAFMIRGETRYHKPSLEYGVGIITEGEFEGHIMGGPASAVKEHCKEYVLVTTGNDKSSSAAKKILKRLGGDLDGIIRSLPAGGCSIKQNKS